MSTVFELPRQKLLVSVLIGGAAIAAISEIPILNMLNCLCCAGVMSGGFLAVWFWKKNLPDEYGLAIGDGAIVGALAGVVGGILTSLFAVLQAGVFSSNFHSEFQKTMDEVVRQMETMGQDPASVEEARQLLSGMAENMWLFILLLLVFTVLSHTLFGMLGGLIGGKVFKREPITTTME